ncbi:MAG: hypothetical protein OXU20_38025 [Myxococcales bacterium]|nr:hypothetical protein [Myxococcales bacterium]MDD9970099.1 hypothetical protein [Myxococcales bacterium]
MAALGGCIVVEDDEPTRLTVVLFWEDGADELLPETQTCMTAGVSWFAWGLSRVNRDGKGKVFDDSDGHKPCLNYIEFGEVPAGEYRLEISGGRNPHNGDGDNDDELEWMANCDDLFVDRFSEEYPCEVFLSEGTFRPPPSRDRESDRSPDRRRRMDAGTDGGLDGGLDGGEE